MKLNYKLIRFGCQHELFRVMRRGLPDTRVLVTLIVRCSFGWNLIRYRSKCRRDAMSSNPFENVYFFYIVTYRNGMWGSDEAV